MKERKDSYRKNNHSTFNIHLCTSKKYRHTNINDNEGMKVRHEEKVRYDERMQVMIYYEYRVRMIP